LATWSRSFSLLLDRNPRENIKVIQDPNKNFLVIMKNGKICEDISLVPIRCVSLFFWSQPFTPYAPAA